jgi:hypothetical protein
MTKIIITHAIAFGLKTWFVAALIYPETGLWTVSLIIYYLLNSALHSLTKDIKSLTVELNKKTMSKKEMDYLLANIDECITKMRP